MAYLSSLILTCDVLKLVFQQLEIDYIIEESNKDLLPDNRGPAAVLRIFGVTEEGTLQGLHLESWSECSPFSFEDLALAMF